MEKIKDDIYVETDFLGCNPSFVITKNGIVLIDTPQKPYEVKYEDTVHIKYPPEASEIFDRFMKMSIGRLYDESLKE